MKIEFGEFKVEFPYEKYLEKHMKENNPFEAMLSKPDPETFNEFFKTMSANMADYFEEFTKTMEKSTKMHNPKKKDE